MANFAIHEDQFKEIPERVFFSGTTAVRRGMGLCYDPTYGTVTDADGKRGKVVEVPDSSNCMCFAGVSRRDYGADASGQWIDILRPGSFCLIEVGAAATNNSGFLTFSKLSADAGRFTAAGFNGRGSAKLRQTEAGGVLLASLAGVATVNADAVTVASGLTASGAAAGDICVIVAGAYGVTIGEYEIESVGSDTALTLVDDGASASSLNCAIYIRPAVPQLVYAELMDGPESGGQTWISPIAGTAVDCEEWGFTRIFGGITLGTASTATLANGTEMGQRVGFLGMGTLTTAGYAITCTTALKQDDATDLNTLTIDAAAEIALLEWQSDQWKTIHSVGATLA